MEHLNPKQLSILCDFSIEKSLYYFLKHDEEYPEHLSKKEYEKKWFLPISTLCKITNIDLVFLISDINKNILKDKQAIDYVAKHVLSKIKVGKTGYPQFVRIPYEVACFLTDSARDELCSIIIQYLPNPIQETIKKNNIKII